MKKYILFSFYFCFLLFPCIADMFTKNYNFEKQQKEIYQEGIDKPILVLPFYEYSTSVLVGNNLYVLKYETFQIRNYGYIYKFDLITGEISNTEIMSGKAFDIDPSEKYICISVDMPYEEKSDIVDVFGLPEFKRRYPLGIQIIELNTGKVFKELYLIPEVTDYYAKFLILSIVYLKDKKAFYVSYAPESASKKLIEGYIDLVHFEFTEK